MTAPASASPWRANGSMLMLFLGVPVIWALHLLVSFYILGAGCGGTLERPRLWLGALTVAALLAAVRVGHRAWSEARALTLDDRPAALEPDLPPVGPGDGRFLTRVGGGIAGIFILGILLLALPLLARPLCE